MQKAVPNLKTLCLRGIACRRMKSLTGRALVLTGRALALTVRALVQVGGDASSEDCVVRVRGGERGFPACAVVCRCDCFSFL